METGLTAAMADQVACEGRRHRKSNLRHRYDLLKTLGRGTYGKVKLAVDRKTGEKVRRLGGRSAAGSSIVELRQRRQSPGEPLDALAA